MVDSVPRITNGYEYMEGGHVIDSVRIPSSIVAIICL